MLVLVSAADCDGVIVTDVLNDSLCFGDTVFYVQEYIFVNNIFSCSLLYVLK